MGSYILFHFVFSISFRLTLWYNHIFKFFKWFVFWMVCSHPFALFCWWVFIASCHFTVSKLQGCPAVSSSVHAWVTLHSICSANVKSDFLTLPTVFEGLWVFFSLTSYLQLEILYVLNLWVFFSLTSYLQLEILYVLNLPAPLFFLCTKRVVGNESSVQAVSDDLGSCAFFLRFYYISGSRVHFS